MCLRSYYQWQSWRQTHFLTTSLLFFSHNSVCILVLEYYLFNPGLTLEAFKNTDACPILGQLN